MAGPQFAAVSPEHHLTVELDGLTALFHRPSGTTHILAPPAPQILEALARGSADADALLARIAEMFDIEAAEDAPLVIGARLAELEAAGLVARA